MRLSSHEGRSSAVLLAAAVVVLACICGVSLGEAAGALEYKFYDIQKSNGENLVLDTEGHGWDATEKDVAAAVIESSGDASQAGESEEPIWKRLWYAWVIAGVMLSVLFLAIIILCCCCQGEKPELERAASQPSQCDSRPLSRAGSQRGSRSQSRPAPRRSSVASSRYEDDDKSAYSARGSLPSRSFSREDGNTVPLVSRNRAAGREAPRSESRRSDAGVRRPSRSVGALEKSSNRLEDSGYAYQHVGAGGSARPFSQYQTAGPEVRMSKNSQREAPQQHRLQDNSFRAVDPASDVAKSSPSYHPSTSVRSQGRAGSVRAQSANSNRSTDAVVPFAMSRNLSFTNSQRRDSGLPLIPEKWEAPAWGENV